LDAWFEKVYLAENEKHAKEEQNNKVLLGDLSAFARGRFEKIYLAGLAKYAEGKQE